MDCCRSLVSYCTLEYIPVKWKEEGPSEIGRVFVFDNNQVVSREGRKNAIVSNDRGNRSRDGKYIRVKAPCKPIHMPMHMTNNVVLAGPFINYIWGGVVFDAEFHHLV